MPDRDDARFRDPVVAVDLTGEARPVYHDPIRWANLDLLGGKDRQSHHAGVGQRIVKVHRDRRRASRVERQGPVQSPRKGTVRRVHADEVAQIWTLRDQRIGDLAVRPRAEAVWDHAQVGGALAHPYAGDGQGWAVVALSDEH